MRKLKLDELNRATVAEFKALSKLPVTLVLDNVRSMHNVGSVFRTADGFAAERIILTGITGQPPHRDIEKTALGATRSVDWLYFADNNTAIDYLRQNNYQLLTIEQAERSIPLTAFIPEPGVKYALIFGNEVDGVHEGLMKAADGCIEIPQFGTKHSFNITVAAGIILWDFYVKLIAQS